MPERVLDFPAALATVLDEAARLAAPARTETLPLARALHRTLATPVIAPRDHPAFDRSTRDGFAVRAADLSGPIRILGSVPAGSLWAGGPISPGEAVEIMTGAPLPPGADAVLMVEHATVSGDILRAHPDRSLQRGDNVVSQGSEAHAGDTLLPSGTLLDAAAIALAASCGRSYVETYARAVVAIVSTGDELVELASEADSHPVPAPQQIFNSNSYALGALVEATGAHPERLPIARDTLADLRARLASARDADLALFTGGVSMGKYDLVEQALAEAGAEFFFTGARIQPGKPVVFGRFANGPCFFGLPGNPVSTEVCFHLFVAPLLRALSGQCHDLAPRFVLATASEAFAGRPNLTRFLPAFLSETQVRAVPWQGSGDLAANARANCFAVVEPQGLEAGDTTRILLRT